MDDVRSNPPQRNLRRARKRLPKTSEPHGAADRARRRETPQRALSGLRRRHRCRDPFEHPSDGSRRRPQPGRLLPGRDQLVPGGRFRAIAADHEAHSFECEARVTYSVPGMGMGLIFTKTSSDQAAELRNWIAELSGEPGAAASRHLQPRIPGSIVGNPRGAEPRGHGRGLSELVSLLQRKGLLDESEANNSAQQTRPLNPEEARGSVAAESGICYASGGPMRRVFPTASALGVGVGLVLLGPASRPTVRRSAPSPRRSLNFTAASGSICTISSTSKGVFATPPPTPPTANRKPSRNILRPLPPVT